MSLIRKTENFISSRVDNKYVCWFIPVWSILFMIGVVFVIFIFSQRQFVFRWDNSNKT